MRERGPGLARRRVRDEREDREHEQAGGEGDRTKRAIDLCAAGSVLGMGSRSPRSGGGASAVIGCGASYDGQLTRVTAAERPVGPPAAT